MSELETNADPWMQQQLAAIDRVIEVTSYFCRGRLNFIMDQALTEIDTDIPAIMSGEADGLDRTPFSWLNWKVDREQHWQEYANCLGVDPDLFFPERGASVREAKEVCRGCVVREECLEYALDNGEKFGVWGGLSGLERRRLRRQRAIERRVGIVSANSS